MALRTQKTDVEKSNKPILVTTFNPNNPDLKAMLLRHWNIIEYSTDCSANFKSQPMVGFRRSKNLKDILVKAVVKYPLESLLPQWWLKTPTICYRLGKCKYCPYINRALNFTSTITNRIHKVLNIARTQHISCELSNLIYLITCKKCGIQYIGETGRKLRDRLYEHLYSIRNKDRISTPVSEHFSLPDHKSRDLSIMVIERSEQFTDINRTTKFRKRREQFWIWQTKSITPLGLNHMI
jgi:hypothetical protein